MPEEDRLIDGFGDPYKEGFRKCASTYCLYQQETGGWFKAQGHISHSGSKHCSEKCYRNYLELEHIVLRTPSQSEAQPEPTQTC